MNERLQSQYLSIEEQNKTKFLGNQIEIDNTWGNPIWGVTLQIDLGEEVKDVLCKYQEELDAIEGGNLFLLPRQFQHISFNQVVFWGGQYRLGAKKTWDSISGDFLSSFQQQNNVFPSFSLAFSKLIATTGGIIWGAFDENDELERLRQIFLQRLPFPKETTRLNHIAHTTVARYKNKLNNPKRVFDYAQSRTASVPMDVKRIVLRNELVFPSLKTEDIAQIELT